VSGATFTADALLAIGLQPSVSVSVRLVMLAAERANHEGLATFDTGELRDLFTDESGERPDSKTVGNILHVAVKSGVVLPDSTVTEVKLDTALVQPEGWPEIGAVYGDFTLMRRVEGSGDKWLCRCTCKRVRTYRIDYLAKGITTNCGQHQ
jgi:hypothetical protein